MSDDAATNPPDGLEPDPQRRASLDRRSEPTPMLSRYTFVGRRRGGRRKGEEDRIYVDRPGGWIIAAFVVLVVLSMLDAAYTLKHIEHGATEANPFMRAALHLGDTAFVIIKTLVTVFAVAFLCLHKNWPLGRLCLVLALLGYTLLTAYHIWGRLAFAYPG